MKTVSITVGDTDYHVLIQANLQVKKAPVLVYVNLQPNSTIGSYIYTIGSGNDTYSTVLQGSANGDLHDLAANLGRLLVKKFGCPSYVCMSGDVNVYDYGALAGEVMRNVTA